MKKTIRSITAVAVALAVFAAYLPVLQHDFWDLDDSVYVIRNFYIRHLNGAFFKWAFFESYAANWHPVTWMSHAIDYALWRLNPRGHYLTNIVFHALNTLLVAVLVARMLNYVAEKRRTVFSKQLLDDRFITVTSAVAALLFGLHPIHVESVAWVSERKDLLCAFFYLLSIISYIGYVKAVAERRSRPYFLNRQYLLTAALFCLALLSKPMAVTLPIVLLVLDWYPFERFTTGKAAWSAVLEKAPLLVLSLASSIVTVAVQRSGGALEMMGRVSFPARAVVALQSLAGYLRNLALPVDLKPFYPYPETVSLLSLHSLFALFLLAGVTALCVVLARKRKMYLSAWLYFVVTLIPVLGLIQAGEQAMADRYTYLPSLGPFLIAAMGAAYSVQSRRAFVLVALLVVATAAGFAATAHALSLRQNRIALWTSFIESEPKVPMGYLLRGRALEKEDRMEAAAADYAIAVRLNPGYLEANSSLGMIYGKMGLYERSVDIFTRSIAVSPAHALSYSNRGRSYYHLGLYREALRDFDKAVELNRYLDIAFVNRAELYSRIGDSLHAYQDFKRACELGNQRACAALDASQARSSNPDHGS